MASPDEPKPSVPPSRNLRLKLSWRGVDISGPDGPVGTFVLGLLALIAVVVLARVLPPMMQPGLVGGAAAIGGLILLNCGIWMIRRRRCALSQVIERRRERRAARRAGVVR